MNSELINPPKLPPTTQTPQPTTSFFSTRGYRQKNPKKLAGKSYIKPYTANKTIKLKNQLKEMGTKRRRGGDGGMEENTMAILDTSCFSKSTQHVADDSM